MIKEFWVTHDALQLSHPDLYELQNTGRSKNILIFNNKMDESDPAMKQLLAEIEYVCGCSQIF